MQVHLIESLVDHQDIPQPVRVRAVQECDAITTPDVPSQKKAREVRVAGLQTALLVLVAHPTSLTCQWSPHSTAAKRESNSTVISPAT
jgi:hypothetical protein